MPNDIAAAVARLKALCELRKQATQGPWVAKSLNRAGSDSANVYVVDCEQEQVFPGYGTATRDKARWSRWIKNATFTAAAANASTDDLPALLAAFEEQGRELERVRMENIRLMAELAGQPPPHVEVVTTTGNCPDVQAIREQPGGEHRQSSSPSPTIFHEK